MVRPGTEGSEGTDCHPERRFPIPIPDPDFLHSLFFPAAAVALIAQFAILWSVIVGRTPASSPGRSARLAEIAWVLLPTLALVVVLWFTWNRLGAEIALEPAAGIPV